MSDDKGRQLNREAAQLGRVGSIGWPSVVISATVFCLVPAVWWAAAHGLISLSIAVPCMVLLQYAAFTPMHESTHNNIGGTRSFRALDLVCGWGVRQSSWCRCHCFAPGICSITPR
jgi:hypothetical protein